MPLGEDAVHVAEQLAKMTERLAKLHMVLGLPDKALPIILSLAHADSVTSVVDALTERVHVALGSGKFDSVDAGRVAPSLIAILRSFMHEAEQYERLVLSHFRSSLWVTIGRRIVQIVIRHPAPDVLDLTFETAGLMEAALWVLSQVSAIYREIHLLQYPIGPASRLSGAEPGMPAPTWDGLLVDLEYASRLDIGPTASRDDLCTGAQWLADRVRIVTQQNLAAVESAFVQVSGQQLASAPSVLSALRELALIAAFTIWFGGQIQAQASRAGGHQSVVTNISRVAPSLTATTESSSRSREAESHCEADIDDV